MNNIKMMTKPTKNDSISWKLRVEKKIVRKRKKIFEAHLGGRWWNKHVEECVKLPCICWVFASNEIPFIVVLRLLFGLFFLMWPFVLFTRIFQEIPSFFVTSVFLKNSFFFHFLVIYFVMTQSFTKQMDCMRLCAYLLFSLNFWFTDFYIVAFFQLKCFERGISSAIFMASWHGMAC